MRKLVLLFIPLMFFFACEDKTALLRLSLNEGDKYLTYYSVENDDSVWLQQELMIEVKSKINNEFYIDLSLVSCNSYSTYDDHIVFFKKFVEPLIGQKMNSFVINEKAEVVKRIDNSNFINNEYYQDYFMDDNNYFIDFPNNKLQIGDTWGWEEETFVLSKITNDEYVFKTFEINEYGDTLSMGEMNYSKDSGISTSSFHETRGSKLIFKYRTQLIK